MSSTPRRLYWELHIRHMFRVIDRDHMSELEDGFDLWKYEDVAARAKWVNGKPGPLIGWVTRGRMPPPGAGGPWPAKWIATLERWAKDGCESLPLADVTQWKASRNGDVVTLTATGTQDGSADIVWIERRNTKESPREYVIYREPVGGSPLPFEKEEEYHSKDKKVTVFDKKHPQGLAIDVT